MKSLFTLLFFCSSMISCQNKGLENYKELPTNNEGVFNNLHYKRVGSGDIFIPKNNSDKFIILSGEIYLFDNKGNELKRSNYYRYLDKDGGLIVTEKGYYKDWVNSPNPKLLLFDKIYNQDLSLDKEILEKQKNELKALGEKEDYTSNEGYKKYKNKKEENYKNLENLESWKLFKELLAKSNDGFYCNTDESYIFLGKDNAIYKAFFDSSFHNKILSHFAMMNVDAHQYKVLEKTIVKRKAFNKKEYFKHQGSILSNGRSHWSGDAFYSIKFNNDIIKFKLSDVGKDKGYEEYVYEISKIWKENEPFKIIGEGERGILIFTNK